MKRAIKKSKYKISNILKQDMILEKSRLLRIGKKSSNSIINPPANQT